MILLDEAIEHLNRAGRAYGVSVKPWSRRSKHRRHILEIEEVVAPLRLPLELRSFWNSWNPGSIEAPCLDGLIPLHSTLEQRDLELPLVPAILLPVADWGTTRIWIELASATHPGGRIFRGHDDDTHVDLWAFGISEFIQLLALGLERDLIDQRTGSFGRNDLESLATHQVREYVSALSPRRVEAVDRSRFPSHWLIAEGLSPDHFDLQGATHTVEQFRAHREEEPHLRATLQGHYENTVCGGPIRGCVGTFRDDSGDIQVFVPDLAGMSSVFGQDGEVEMDVLSFSATGTGIDHLTARDDMQLATDMGVTDLGNDVVLRLTEQLKYLDTSIVVTGIRPIR